MRLLFRWLTREKLELLYIGGCEVLPEPLNAREEQACIEAMQDHQDKEAKEKLIACVWSSISPRNLIIPRWEPKT